MGSKEYIIEKSLKEFRDTGLLYLINSILHVFGWAITLECTDGEFTRMYPARVKFRGFSNEIATESYIKISEYLSHSANTLLEEAKE